MLAKLIEQGHEDQAKTIICTGNEELKNLIPKFYMLNALMPSKWDLPQASPTDSYINITETVWITAVYNWTEKLRMEEEKRQKEELKRNKGKKPKAPEPKEKPLNLKQNFLNETSQAPQKGGEYLKHILGAQLGGRY
jgi:hypothetical protein